MMCEMRLLLLLARPCDVVDVAALLLVDQTRQLERRAGADDRARLLYVCKRNEMCLR